MVVYIDDIFVSGKDEQEHLKCLEQVLLRLEDRGLRVKRDKCEFLRLSVEYLGYRLDREGIHPLNDKVTAIVEAPEPRNVKELRAFLGLVNYYRKFIKQLSTIAHPLNQLLCMELGFTLQRELKSRLASSGSASTL